MPDAVRARWDAKRAAWAEARAAWNEGWEALREAQPEAVASLESWCSGAAPSLADVEWPTYAEGSAAATRATSGKALQALAAGVPQLVGGSADLAGSNKTYLEGLGDVAKGSYGARNVRYGVREHAMGAMMNGMALHGGVIPYGGTFLVFSDYCRPSVRLSALMGLRVVWVFTHDSVFLGEDGPTHQPVEHLMALRSIPGLKVVRPADGRETNEAWALAMEGEGPTALALTRQNVPELPRPEGSEGAKRGGYVVWGEGDPELILIATGSEVHVALEVAQTLAQEDGLRARVVSLPCWEVFLAQDEAYRESVLPSSCGARVSFEAGITWGWERFVGELGLSLGVDRYGASAPAEVLAEQFGLTAPALLARVRSYVN